MSDNAITVTTQEERKKNMLLVAPEETHNTLTHTCASSGAALHAHHIRRSPTYKKTHCKGVCEIKQIN